MQVFIAWSSERTLRLADALASLLGDVVEGLDVFVSSRIGRLHPYLLGLDVRHVPDPLQQFQATGTTRAETRAMVASIAGQHGDRGPWSNRFEAAWPPPAQVLEELRWMDLEEAVPRFFEGFNCNTFLTEMPTGTPERLHRYVVADHLSERLLASRLVVESHCAPEVDRHFGRVVKRTGGVP